MLIRKPHAAGTFYPSEAGELSGFCQENLSPPHPEAVKAAKAVILPHAGYVYSGVMAGKVLSAVDLPKKVLLIGPNHSGRGGPFALASGGRWQTPLGEVPVDRASGAELMAECDELSPDDEAHRLEHSLEVEIPFLQTKNPRLEIIPLVVGTLDPVAAKRVALACGKICSQKNEPCLIVVSTDMSHYEPDHTTREKDRYAIDAILDLDAEELMRVVKEHRITMCGIIPVYMLLVMKDLIGIKNAELVEYGTSADATGDKDRVVGYAGFIFR